MKTFSLATLSAAFIVFAGPAAAQSGTDEARALAAQQHQLVPYGSVSGVVSVGDYRAAAHEQQRLAQWQARQQAVRAYAAGVRSTPIVVSSEDSARAEAQRVHAEQALAEQAGGLRATVAAQ
ncbi:MAG: hypothetical protein KIT35_22130 [Piscinibacter sp.]|uniref:hypothetical protein n=1 Tax=Piscinibacter sp. TaxID=1903157 RepID=UPI0025839381|nr:hypothetical protein [Piscinibacter sp.]MCW5666539.1 hypothetical protein [Piscinibacter sp.]